MGETLGRIGTLDFAACFGCANFTYDGECRQGHDLDQNHVVRFVDGSVICLSYTPAAPEVTVSEHEAAMDAQQRALNGG